MITYELRGGKIYTDLEQCIKRRHGIVLCDSLELAQYAKFFLIKKVQDGFEKEVERLRTKINKNIPDIDSAITVIKETHPEVFI